MLKCHWWDQSYFWEVWSVSEKQPATCVTLQETWWCHHISCEGTDAVWAHNRPAFLPAHTATVGRVSITETPRQFSRWQPSKQALAWGHRGEVSWESNDQQDKVRLFSRCYHFTRSQLHCQLHDVLQSPWSPRRSPSIWDCLSSFSLDRSIPAQIKTVIISITLCHEFCCNIPSLPLHPRLPTCRKSY